MPFTPIRLDSTRVPPVLVVMCRPFWPLEPITFCETVFYHAPSAIRMPSPRLPEAGSMVAPTMLLRMEL